MRRFTCGTATLLASLALASGTASAAPITVGSPLNQTFKPTLINSVATIANSGSTEAGAKVFSPVTGAVIEWHVVGAQGGPFVLKVLRPVGGGVSFSAVGASAGALPSGLDLQTFPTAVPIQTGDLIAIDNTNKADLLGIREFAVGAGFFGWVPPLPVGATAPPGQKRPEIEVGFNAVVQPAPTITAVSPKTGTFKGGTKVTISGTDLTGASAVSFGGIAVKRFTVDSESQITAVTGAAKKPGPATVSVSTVAGTATANGFKLTACVVPNLKNKMLEAAKKKLKKAKCKLGKVKKTNGVTGETGKVTKQGKKAGKKLAPGTKVNVTLG